MTNDESALASLAGGLNPIRNAFRDAIGSWTFRRYLLLRGQASPYK
jgi:hypothetical protein